MISDWNELFGAQAAAFAALTGLVFVALSINLKEILEQPGLSGRAAEAVVVLVEPVFIGLVGLLPHQCVRTLGGELLVIGVSSWALTTLLVIRNWHAVRERPPHEMATRLILVEVATLLIVAGAALLTAGHQSGLYWETAGAGVCLVTGLVDGWVLLVEILR